jgi:hypothetical protein
LFTEKPRQSSGFFFSDLISFMRLFISFALIFSLCCSFLSKDSACPKLTFDGIYVYKLDEETSAVIRFYDDKVVLVSTSINDYSKVMTWFNRDPENFSRVLTGKYKIGTSNCTIRFNVKGETGEQKYSGTIADDKTLNLHIFNPKDQTSTDRTYTYVKP